MSRGFWELLLLLFNSAVRPAETGERSCRGDFPDESLGPAQFFDLGRRNLPQIVMDRYEVIDRPPGVRELLLQVSFAALLSHHPSPLLIPVPYSQNTSEV